MHGNASCETNMRRKRVRVDFPNSFNLFLISQYSHLAAGAVLMGEGGQGPQLKFLVSGIKFSD